MKFLSFIYTFIHPSNKHAQRGKIYHMEIQDTPSSGGKGQIYWYVCCVGDDIRGSRAKAPRERVLTCLIPLELNFLQSQKYPLSLWNADSKPANQGQGLRSVFLVRL